MKLDVNVLRYLSREDFRVLTAVEMGQKNHELVPVQLIDTISGLKHGGAHRCLKTLLRHKLVHHESAKYDGYRLTYMGYDFLAIKVLVNRGHISSVGRQIGVGKESDIFEVMNDEGEVFALKLHRLGRTSFRAVKSKRDYLGRRSSFSWLYLSRLAALKEYAFMKALGNHGFPVPVAIDNNRHAVLMTLVDAVPLVQVREIARPAVVYNAAMELIARLGAKGLVHCDFNEFNLLVDDDEQLTLIDFPQMVSMGHANAQELFERDVECIIRFFNKKIGYMPQQDEALNRWRPDFGAALAAATAAATAAGGKGLDAELAASGFQRQHQQALEEYMAAATSDDGDDAGDDDGDDGDDIGSEEDVSDEREGFGSEGGREDAAGSSAGEDEDNEGLGPSSSNEQLPVTGSGRGAAAAGSGDSGAAVAAEAAAAAERRASEGAAGASRSQDAAVGADGDDADDMAAALEQLGIGRGQEDEEAGDAGSDEDAKQQSRPRKAASRHRSSVAGSVAGDAALQERLVQQRLSQQRRQASQAAAAAKASRNTSKAKGKKGSNKGGGGLDW